MEPAEATVEVLVKTTEQLTLQEIEGINALFFEVFNRELSVSAFLERFTNTAFGFSYHGLLVERNRIVGVNSCIPFYYFRDNDRFKLALSVDSMVSKNFRGFENYKRIVDAVQQRLVNDGFKLRIGFPNEKSYPVAKAGFKHLDIGTLHTYVLLRNIGSVIPGFKAINIISRIIAKTIILTSTLSRSKEIQKFLYRKDRCKFDLFRYKWCGSDYHKVILEDFAFVYRIKTHENVRTAFLMDVHPLSRRNFDSAVRYIYKHEEKRLDAIIFVGNLPFAPYSLLRVPSKLEPKKFRFTCKPIDETFFDPSITEIRNWEINLSNFDLV